MNTLKLKRISAKVQLSNGKIIIRRSISPRKIFAFLRSVEKSDIWEAHVFVSYTDSSEPLRNDFQNQGVYTNVRDATEALRAFIEITK